MINIRKYILPSLLILALAGSVALAQTITRAIQLSQDTSGAFGVDANNNIYFPAHLLVPANTNTPIPTITGTGTPTLSGTDAAGLITMGASATTAVAVFGRAYVTTPFCVVTWQAPMNGTATPIAYTLTTTRISISQGATSGNLINYMCKSLS